MGLRPLPPTGILRALELIRNQGAHMGGGALDRRAFVGYFSSIGLSGTLLPGVLWAQVAQQQAPKVVTKEMIAQAEKVAGLEFSDAEREEMVRGLDQNL